MSDWGTGGRGSRGRIATWDEEARRRAVASASRWPDLGRAIAERLRDWAIAETGPGRLLPWLPVAFGLGIAIYFTAEREPAWWAVSALAAVCAGGAILDRTAGIQKLGLAQDFAARRVGQTVQAHQRRIADQVDDG